MAPVVVVQQYLITDGITGQIGLVDGILPVIIFLRHMVSPAQHVVGQFIQQDHRIQLLGIPHQHQILPPDDRHQGHCRIALACLIQDGHIKHRLRASQLVGGDTCGDDNGKHLLKLFYMSGLTQVLGEGNYLPVFLLCPIQDFPQIAKLFPIQLLQIPGRCVV